MKKLFTTAAMLIIIAFSTSIFAQGVKIGPRLTGNLNIFNQDGLTGTWNGVGVGIGGTVDVSFSRALGIITNLHFFDMKNFSNETTNNNTTTEYAFSLSYLSIDPLFKAEFSGFYLVGGFSVGIKISSSGELTQSTIGQNPTVQSIDPTTNSIKFDIAFGTGYNFQIAQTMYLAPDFMAYIPINNTFDSARDNSTLSLKLGVSLKFRIN